jgi:hypothetical protein
MPRGATDNRASGNEVQQGGGRVAYSLKNRRYRSRRSSTHAITELRAERNYTLWLRFDDGLEGRVYLGDLITTHTFGVLSDEEMFRRAQLDPISNTVTWEGEIALDPDALYRDVASKSVAALH